MSRDQRILVIASGNQGKIREFQGLLANLPVSVEAQPDGLDIDETFRPTHVSKRKLSPV